MRDKNKQCGVEEIQRLILFPEILLLGKFQNILLDNFFIQSHGLEAHVVWINTAIIQSLMFFFFFRSAKRDQMFQENVTTRCPD